MWLALRTVLLFQAALCLAEQRYDGWYNNLANPKWGSVGEDIAYEVAPAYADMTATPSGANRPNPREISNAIFDGPSGLASRQNHTALFAYFGQLVSYEVVHASSPSCPAELLHVPVPDDDPDFNTNRSGQQFLPFVRSSYNKNSGISPGNPRKPTNKVSSWIDGNFLYGSSEVWCNCLRAFTGGRLQSLNGSRGALPAKNKIGLPLDNNPSPVTNHMRQAGDLWMFGDVHSHQNPGLTALALVWFRYHNAIADSIQRQHPTWSDSKIFAKTRRHVIAVLQNVIMYEWLPEFVGQRPPTYHKYQRHLNPSISALFEAAAMRAGHSEVPPGIYLRDEKCRFRKTKYGKALRLCNTYWHSQEVLEHHGLEPIILGMASQLSENMDHVIVKDLRGRSFGPLHFSRHDLTVTTIVRGRDHGLPDYNSARKTLGLPVITDWKDINPELYKTNAQIFERLAHLYNHSFNDLDIYPLGLLESTSKGPGRLFSSVVMNQFIRIRDADRHWFENRENNQFTDDEIDEIRSTKFSTVIMKAMKFHPDMLQSNAFLWRKGDPCPQPKQLTEDDMEDCTPHKGYDYFSGSEVAYITAFTCLALLPFLCILVAYIIAKCRQYIVKRREKTLQQINRRKRPNKTPGMHAVEWQGDREQSREVAVSISASECTMTLHSPKGSVCLRKLDLARLGPNVSVWCSCDSSDIVMVHVPREYDMIQQCKEIVDCELSREEFAEALAMKSDSLFVEQMFSVIDHDGNGYISFRELLYAVLLFAQGSCEDKLQLLFMMYDVDRNGSLSRTEVKSMIKSLLEIANSSLNIEEIDQLVHEMFTSAGLDGNSSLKLDDFKRVLGDHMDMLWDVCIDLKGGLPLLLTSRLLFWKHKENQNRWVDFFIYFNTCTCILLRNLSSQRTRSTDTFTNDLESKQTMFTQKLISWRHHFENQSQKLVYLFIFFSICLLVFAERFYYYAVEQEHIGLRSIAGYGVALTRGAAAGMSFTFSLLLLTMCRNTITRLRETVINLYIPFDSHISFHKIVACAALFFTVVHIVGYCFNFYHVATQPVSFLCMFDEIYFRSDFLPKVDWWLFKNLTGITGILLVLVICIIYIFATATSRRHIFNAFWITHQFIYLLYLLIFLHGASRIIQEPSFLYYFIGPGIIYMFDKVISLSRSKKELSVVRAELLPSGVTFVEIKRPVDFEYRSGQWVRLACDPLGSDEYHALTLTSAPHEETLSVHVRAVGPWTQNLRMLMDPDRLNDQPYPKLYIDGPFGAGQQDWFRFEVSILVAGGIGVTPYASILKDFAFMTSINNTFRMKCKKVYFIWVTGNQKHFEWFVDIIRQVEEVDAAAIVDTHIFITQMFNSFDLRTMMLYICEENFQRLSGRSTFTGLKAKTHFGRPNFDKIFEAVGNKHPQVQKVGVFSCGPPGLTKGVCEASKNTSCTEKTMFIHHFENF
ncbi:hypothetical protein CAPTEDRAFT_191097 [Capitella teleta]|uniref:NAD(P)H oxidase (H2O2-forming) n=1 Tax=Capitella teleta TaxID=283909 RepID=R7URF0_CAPTE|nr:hypothetical protein CAPTEDRAFT_191097 [Capitella teleta]|eukprot:ELU06497.1 hypothetical protein CAPTEDRAFT_191097 [Capitella teleta]